MRQIHKHYKYEVSKCLCGHLHGKDAIKLSEEPVAPETLAQALYPTELVDGKRPGWEAVKTVPIKLTKGLKVIENDAKFA